MTIKNTKLGGTDFTTPSDRVKPTDLNNTFDEVANRIAALMNLTAISNYKILQANNVFENGDDGFVDEYVDSNGTNNTISGATAYFVTDHYILNYGAGSETAQAQVNGGTNYSSSGNKFGDKYHANMDIFIHSVTKRSDVPDTFAYITTTGGTILATASFSGNVATFSSPYYIASGTDFLIVSDQGGTSRYGKQTGGSFPYNYTPYNITAGIYGNTTATTSYIFQFTSIGWSEATRNSSDTVPHVTNTYTLDGSEKGLVIFGKVILQANTSIVYDVTDGTTTISDVNAGEYVDISSFTSGTLNVTEKLQTTDINYTPSSYGISVVVLK